MFDFTFMIYFCFFLNLQLLLVISEKGSILTFSVIKTIYTTKIHIFVRIFYIPLVEMLKLEYLISKFVVVTTCYLFEVL